MIDIIFNRRKIWEHLPGTGKSCQCIWFCGYDGKIYFGCDYANQKWSADLFIKSSFKEPYVSRSFALQKSLKEIKKIKYAEKFSILIRLDYDVTKDDVEKRKIIETAVLSLNH